MPVLTHPLGVENRNESSFASREQAFLDMLYLYGDTHIDTPNGLDWNKIFDMLPIYQNQSMERRVRRAYKYQQENKP